jgi:hypothetical protein
MEELRLFFCFTFVTAQLGRQNWWGENVCLGNHFRLFVISKGKKNDENRREVTRVFHL